jgi:glutathione S-transferase
MEWMSFLASDLHKAGFMPLIKKATPADYRPIARQLVLNRLQWLNQHLADREYLTGPTFTVADAHCYTIAMWTAYQDIDVSPWPHLQAYLARIGARPSVIAAKEAERREAEAQRAAAQP